MYAADYEVQYARLRAYYGARLVKTLSSDGAHFAPLRQAKTGKVIGSNWMCWSDQGYITAWLSTDDPAGAGHTMNTIADVDAFIAAHP